MYYNLSVALKPLLKNLELLRKSNHYKKNKQKKPTTFLTTTLKKLIKHLSRQIINKPVLFPCKDLHKLNGPTRGDTLLLFRESVFGQPDVLISKSVGDLSVCLIQACFTGLKTGFVSDNTPVLWPCVLTWMYLCKHCEIGPRVIRTNTRV